MINFFKINQPFGNQHFNDLSKNLFENTFLLLTAKVEFDFIAFYRFHASR